MEDKEKYDSTPYTMQEAIAEAQRCLNCKKPQCRTGCPIENQIPDFIHQLSMGNFGEARAILSERTNLPAICGRVCSHERQCQGHCIMNKKGNPIKIGKLEQFVADFDMDMQLTRHRMPLKTRGKVAVIGSGPAGLTVAGDLSKMGFNVTVYEAEKEPGGILIYGIPEFRLPKSVVKKEIQKIEELGVHFINDTVIGPETTLQDLFDQGFDAIFIGTGTAVSKSLDIPGHTLRGIAQSHYFLRRVERYKEGELDRDEVYMDEGDTVLVIGSGNVAMDTARTAVRMGAKEVTVVCRESEDNITADTIEYEGALSDGVKFKYAVTPMEYVSNEIHREIHRRDGVDVKESINNSSEGVAALKVKNADGEIEEIPCNRVMIAIGSKPAKRIVSTTPEIKVNEDGYITTKEKPYGMTTMKGVFAGGDVVHRPATVVLAMREAKKTALGIASYVDAVKLLEM